MAAVAAALAPALRGADQLALAQGDVEAPIAERPVHRAQIRRLAQFEQPLAERIAQASIGVLDAMLFGLVDRHRPGQGDVEHRRRLRHRLATGVAQGHRPAQLGAGRRRAGEAVQPLEAARHHQRGVLRAPQQQRAVGFAGVHPLQQRTLGIQAGLDRQALYQGHSTSLLSIGRHSMREADPGRLKPRTQDACHARKIPPQPRQRWPIQRSSPANRCGRSQPARHARQ
ncbi:hypothetical protein D3C78_1145210 [compost metagenome]